MASPTTPPILVLGSLNTDLITIAPRLPAAGETLAANDFHIAAGGKGANQATACSRLSHPHSNNVRMAGAVGGDAFGPQLVRALQRSGVDVARVQTLADAATGTAVIVVEAATGENRILIHAGANGRVTPTLVGGEDVFSSPPAAAVVLQLEIPLPTVLWALRAARLRGLTTVFNPAPAPPAAELPDHCWRDVDCVVVNESEAAQLAGVAVEALDAKEGVEAAGRWFVQRGCAACVVTLGARGCFWICDGQSGWGDVKGEGEVVDTTGAGDTFVGGLTVALVEGRTLREAVEFASEASGRAVRKRGAMDGVPWRAELKV